MYIVISKPKRMSSKAGCDHCMGVSWWVAIKLPGRNAVTDKPLFCNTHAELVQPSEAVNDAGLPLGALR